jgi:hypothetical protein
MQCRSSKDIRPALTGGEFIRNSNVILGNGNATCKQSLSPQLSDGLASSRRGRAAAKTVWELRTQLLPSFGYLVQLLEWHHHRVLLSNRGSTATP